MGDLGLSDALLDLASGSGKWIAYFMIRYKFSSIVNSTFTSVFGDRRGTGYLDVYCINKIGVKFSRK